MEAAPSKSSVSCINKHRDWELFRDYYFEVLEHLQVKGMPGRSALRNIKRKVFLMDASVIPLCLSLFDWAAYRKRKGGLNLHTILDYDGLLSVFCHITDARTHEVTVGDSYRLASIPIPKEAFWFLTADTMILNGSMNWTVPKCFSLPASCPTLITV